MKKMILSALVLGLAGVAMAEHQFDIDPTALPASHGYPMVTGTFANVFGNTYGPFEAEMSGPSGFPEYYHAVFLDNGMNPLAFTYFTGVTLTFDCAGTPVSYTLTPPPFQMPYLFTPGSGAAAPTDFGVDSQMNCMPHPAGTDDLPVAFELGSAFPNPFNPSTTISFALPSAELVKLNVFNITGQKVATLANEMMVRGNHEITFDASALSSGVYMYTIEAGDFTATKKMVLVK